MVIALALTIVGLTVRSQRHEPKPSRSITAAPSAVSAPAGEDRATAADASNGAGRLIEGGAVARVKLFIADWAAAWRDVRATIDDDPMGALDRWDASISAVDERHFVRGASCGSQGAFSRVRADHDPATETIVNTYPLRDPRSSGPVTHVASCAHDGNGEEVVGART